MICFVGIEWLIVLLGTLRYMSFIKKTLPPPAVGRNRGRSPRLQVKKMH